MSSSTQAQQRSSTMERLELRLKNAEKQVAQVLGTMDYDELITIASGALSDASRSENKIVLKSRKNLLWARSQAYHRKGLHSLALKDARAVMKIQPDDVAAYIRTATLLHDAGHVDQARDCIDKAETMARSYEPSARSLWLRRVKKQRRAIFQGSACPAVCLPNEVLVHIAMYLDAASRTAMSGTCRSWRETLASTSTVWSLVAIKLPQKPLSGLKARDFVRHLVSCAEMANNRIESFSLSGLVPTKLLCEVCCILRPSAPTLAHISLSSPDQSRCYDLLYRHCPALKSLVIDVGKDYPVEGEDAFLLTLRQSALPDEAQPAGPFQLEHFSESAGVHHPDLLPHMGRVRILKKFDPFRVFYTNDAARQAGHARMLQSLAHHLEEWEDAESRNQRHFPSVTTVFTFPKLVKLTNFQAEPDRRFVCPKLEELSVTTSRVRDDDFEMAVVNILDSTTTLRRLALLSGRINHGTRGDLMSSVHTLRSLEALDLRLQWTFDASELLLPAVMVKTGVVGDFDLPLPKLRELRLNLASQSIAGLVHALLVRDHLRTGAPWRLARQWAAKSFHDLERRPPAASAGVTAFHRGSRRNNSTERQVSTVEGGPRLKNAAEYCSIKTLHLTQITYLDESSERALRSIVPELHIEYARL